MKKSISFSIIILFSIILFSCTNEPINMLTKINPDGSCLRSFTVEGDSAFMVGDTTKHNPFPFNLDSSWSISWSYLTKTRNDDWPLKIWEYDTASKKIYFTAERYFPSVSELNQPNFFELTNWKSFHPEIIFEKSFRWFYTYYQFSEKYQRFRPFQKLPISDFLEEDEIKLWFQGDDNFFNGMNGIEINDRLNKIEKQYEIWLERNFFEEQYQVILKYLFLVKDLKITEKEITTKKDSIFKKYREMDDDFPELLHIMDTTFRTTEFSEKIGKNKDVENEVESLFDFLDYYEMVLNYKLLMPGKILQTNSSIVKADTLFWEVNTFRFTECDYEIFAKSRKPNLWAIVISGIFILGVILSYFVSLHKKAK